MSPADLGDSVALEALQDLLDAVWADHHRPRPPGADVIPDAILAAHRSAGLVLADRAFLVIDEAAHRDDIETHLDIAEFERVACTRLLARLDVVERQTDLALAKLGAPR